jgi:hypothetical protein
VGDLLATARAGWGKGSEGMGKVEQTPRFIRPGEHVRIPREVAICPTCGRALVAHAEEWTVDDGVPTRGGVYVECSRSAHPNAMETREPWRYWEEPRARAIAYVRLFCRIRKADR